MGEGQNFGKRAFTLLERSNIVYSYLKLFIKPIRNGRGGGQSSPPVKTSLAKILFYSGLDIYINGKNPTSF